MRVDFDPNTILEFDLKCLSLNKISNIVNMMLQIDNLN